MRKGFKFIPMSDVVTPVYDAVSKTIPDQSLSLRDMLLQFAYISGEKLSEIVNRGFNGDEDDDDILGVDVGALDFAEIHDRLMDLQRSAPVESAPSTPQVEVTEETPSDTPQD